MKPDGLLRPAGHCPAPYVRSLGRDPTKKELEALDHHLAKANDKPASTRETLDDIFWALLNLKEFLFNH